MASSLALDGMLLSYGSVVEESHQGIVDQIVPSALKYFDLQNLVAAIAPRKVTIFSSVNPLRQELPISRLRQEYGIPQTKSTCAIGRNSYLCRFWSASSVRNHMM